ncbi:flagellar hook-basal body protein [Tumebacillus permanentifrigoris]|uniref:Flagellar basal-body rod protein FlgG n=1 Tax=Tumebacillus permanentifrigoris TaxID=378543 RepID=A0A316DI01_9BACL|nr:flagellar hook-basal body protein [Tumebacillus permanentifrigoris]PWK16243.1 flagellar basal-body rod protein FlgG [Tumebacillus permanentifrigoris]
MRALYTSAHGMNAQQSRLDTIGHNLANLNTTGYKTEDVQFKDMLYMTMLQKDEVKALDKRQTTENLRLGAGVLAVGTALSFVQGSLQSTQSPLDVAIEGDGFFKVRAYDQNGQQFEAYTRDGSFKVGQVGTEQYLVTADGNPVLDTTGNPINLTGFETDSLTIDENGMITGLPNAAGGGGAAPGQATPRLEVGQLEVTRVVHPESNLVGAGENLFRLHAQVNALDVQANAVIVNGERHSRVQQRAVEMSNVDMSTQMTEMIVAQRAYSMNARALTTTDQMMGIANSLRS